MFKCGKCSASGKHGRITENPRTGETVALRDGIVPGDRPVRLVVETREVPRTRNVTFKSRDFEKDQIGQATMFGDRGEALTRTEIAREIEVCEHCANGMVREIMEPAIEAVKARFPEAYERAKGEAFSEEVARKHVPTAKRRVIAGAP